MKIVNNSNTEVSFRAVDWCVTVFRTGTYKFEETILSFKEHHPNFANQIVKPILCNPSF